MHLSEGLLPATQALAWGVASAPFVVHSTRRAFTRGSDHPKYLGLTTALTFAVTLFPIPIPGLGATSHLCATPLLGLILGPQAMALPVMASLLVQALLFAHGGLSTLGANVFTLGVVAPWSAWLVAKALRRLGLNLPLSVALACALGATAVYTLDAAMLGWALQGERTFGHWFRFAILGFAPAQTPLLALEGILSFLLLKALLRLKLEALPSWLKESPKVSLPALGALLLLGTHFQGLDESVLEHGATQAGRHPRPLVDLTEGETGLALFMGGGLVAGFVLGRGWERWTLKKADSQDA